MIFKIKQLLLSFIYHVDQWLPRSIRVYVRNRCVPWRPVLDAVEFHLADRCNMNCTGCSHFSPFADEWFADASTVERDLEVLSAKFRGGIRHVNLLGGEPLLHDDVIDVMMRVRRACPDAIVTMVTNGIKLLEEPPEFWQVCRKLRIKLNLTLYPPVVPMRNRIERKCREEGVRLRILTGDVFFARMVPDGSADSVKAFYFCRLSTYCPYLREGRLYRCAQEYHIADFIEGIGGKGGIDIGDDSIRARDILHYLMTPGKICSFCSDKVRLFPWSRGSRDKSDWCYRK